MCMNTPRYVNGTGRTENKNPGIIMKFRIWEYTPAFFLNILRMPLLFITAMEAWAIPYSLEGRRENPSGVILLIDCFSPASRRAFLYLSISFSSLTGPKYSRIFVFCFPFSLYRSHIWAYSYTFFPLLLRDILRNINEST